MADDEWVAVEPEFQNAASKIKGATSAYMFFQKDAHEKGIGAGLDISERMKAIAEAWRELDESARSKFVTLAEKDRSRYNAECEERDAEAEREQELKRQARNAEVTEPRVKQSAAKIHVSRGPRVYSKEELAAKASKKADRMEKLDEIAKQAAAVDASLAEKAQKRLQYLLSQSDVFSAFGVGSKIKSTNSSSSGSSSSKDALSPPSPSKRRDRALSRGDENDEGGGMGGDEDLGSGEPQETIRLMKQPSNITGGEMRAYQLEGLNWMIKLQENGVNGILADEMGLGKTLQSISILAFMQQYRNKPGPHLVLVPKSTLSNWMKEFQRWCPSLRTLSFHGDKESRQEMIQNRIKPGSRIEDRDWDVLVTTYEICNMELSALTKISFNYLVIDEAHRIKNESSTFSKSIRQLKTLHRLLLTGTPLQNNLHELWALLNFMLPDVFEDPEQFDSLFNLDIDDADAKTNMIGMLHKILRPFMLRRLKADVEKSLPPKSEIMIFTSLSKMQKEVYKNILRRELTTVNGNDTKSKSGLQNICMHLRKACGHPYLFEGVEDRALDPMGEHLVENCGKMKLLDKLLAKMKERGHRVLVFSQMTRMLDILEDFMIMRGYQYCRIDGDTSYDDRQEQIDDYNSPNTTKFIFLLSTRAGGLGINLQTADTVVLYDSDWNPQCDLQAMDRAHRIGQKKVVNVYRLVTESTIEEKVVMRAQQKLKLDAMVVQQGRLQSKDTLSKNDLMDALRFGAEKIFRNQEGDDVTDEDIDIILDRGKKKTDEMMDKLVDAEKGDMLDFKLDGGMNIQTFEGEDYSAEGRAKEKLMPIIDTMLLLEEECATARIRKPVANQLNYDENLTSKNETKVKKQKPRSKLPDKLKLPSMHKWMLFQTERLNEIHAQEEAKFLSLFGVNGQHLDAENLEGQEKVKNVTSEYLLGKELANEKAQLLAEGFPNWRRDHFTLFLRLSARFGRDDVKAIAAEMSEEDMSFEEVCKYQKAFWERASTVFGEQEFSRMLKNIEKGEKKLNDHKRLMEATEKVMSRFEDPWNDLTLNAHMNTCLSSNSYTLNSGSGSGSGGGGGGATGGGGGGGASGVGGGPSSGMTNSNNLSSLTKEFSYAEDKILLNLSYFHGYGNWDKIQQDLCRIDSVQQPDLQFNYSLKSLSYEAIAKRCETLMRQTEKDVLDYEKKIEKEKVDMIKYENDKMLELNRLTKAAEDRKLHVSKLEAKILEEKEKLEELKALNEKVVSTEDKETMREYEKVAVEKGFISKNQSMLQDSIIMKDISIMKNGVNLPPAAIAKKKSTGSTSSASMGGKKIPFPSELSDDLITMVVDSVAIGCEKLVDRFISSNPTATLSKKCVKEAIDELCVKDYGLLDESEKSLKKDKKTMSWRKKTDSEVAEWKALKAKEEEANAAKKIEEANKPKLAPSSSSILEEKPAEGESSPKKSPSKKVKSQSDATSGSASKKIKGKQSSSSSSATKKSSAPTSAKKRKDQAETPVTDKTDRAPKKPKSAQSLFNIAKRGEIRKALKDIDPLVDSKAVEEELKMMWANLSAENKEEWELKAANEQIKYKRDLKIFKESQLELERAAEKAAQSKKPKKSELSIDTDTAPLSPKLSSSASTTPLAPIFTSSSSLSVSSIPKKGRSMSEDETTDTQATSPKKSKPSTPSSTNA